MPDLSIPTAAHGDLPVYVARPNSASKATVDGRVPGVVVLHDILGMSPDLRHQTEWLADAGYLAIAPNLFHWGGKLRCIRSVIADVLARKGRSFDEIEAARVWLTAEPECSGKVGVIGFCLGGGFAILVAPRGGFAAAAPNYGRVPGDVDSLLAGACPMVASFGAKDGGLRGAAKKLERSLVLNHVAHDVKEYADAGHGFLDDHQPSDVAPVMRIVRNVAGIAYHEPSATDARRRILSFFDVHLKGNAAP